MPCKTVCDMIQVKIVVCSAGNATTFKPKGGFKVK